MGRDVGEKTPRVQSPATNRTRGWSIDTPGAAGSVGGRMLSRLLTWLDTSTVHHGVAAWGAAGLVAVLALVPAPAGRPRAWWRHPAWFGGLLLLGLLAFRWPIVCANEQLADPDESQLLAGAMVLRHDPVFWRGVDGTTHGPVAEWPLLAPALFGGPLDYTTARLIAALFVWSTLLSAWAVFRHWFGEPLGRALALPIFATHAFTHFWDFVPYTSEHAATALLAGGSALVLTSLRGDGGRLRGGRLFLAGLALGAAPFGKLQALPPAAFLAAAAGLLVATTPAPRSDRGRALLALGLGGLTGPAVVLAPTLLAGAGGDFWRGYIVNNLQYAGGRWFAWAASPVEFVALGREAWGFHPFFLWLLGFSVVATPLVRRFDAAHRRLVWFAWGLLLVSLYAILAPGRMFMHYLQFAHFPIALLAGCLAGGALSSAGTWPRLARWSPVVVHAGGLALFLAVGLLPQILWRTHEDYPYLSRYRATGGRLTVSPAAREILRHAQPGERLAIWGWMPNLWVETGLWQATRDGNTWRQIEAAPDREAYRARFLADLRRSTPPVFVDAVGGDNFSYKDRAAAGHETFSALREYLEREYRLVADVEGSRIYLRRDRS